MKKEKKREAFIVGGTHPSQIFKRRRMPKRWGYRSPSTVNLKKGFGYKGTKKLSLLQTFNPPTKEKPEKDKINDFFVDSGSDEESSRSKEEEEEETKTDD